MFLLRVLTALVLMPIIIAVVAVGSDPIFILVLSFILGLAIWEWSALVEFKSTSSRYIYTLIITSIVFAVTSLIELNIAVVISMIAIMWWCFCLYVIVAFQNSRILYSQYDQVRAIYGVFLFVPAAVGMMGLRKVSDTYSEWLIALLILIWLADSGAYFAGKMMGKRKLAVQVSPGKSWEGGSVWRLSAGGIGCVCLFPVG